MRKQFIFVCILLLWLSGCKVSAGKGSSQSKTSTTRANALSKSSAEGTETFHLDSMLVHHQYFKLQDLFEKHQEQLPEQKALFVKALLDAAFNRREESNRSIQKLLHENTPGISMLERILLLETAAINSLYLYDYVRAYQYTQALLAIEAVDGQKRKEHQNNLRIYQTLQASPPQTIQRAPSELPIDQDQAGLSRIPTQINGIQKKVVFDTGANFSVITDSLALSVGMEIKETSFKVTSITGMEIDSRIGIAKNLRLGNTLLEHVVFLVFPEASLSFPQIDYTIDAILGFPVINALQEVQLIDLQKFLITESPDVGKKANMALDFLTPLVEVMEQDESLTFTFDTGANATNLYASYFHLRKEQILEIGSRDTVMVGGAGGAVKVPIHRYPFEACIGNSPFLLNQVAVYPRDLKDYPGIHGNLGQDILGQFDTLKLNFKEMRIELK